MQGKACRVPRGHPRKRGATPPCARPSSFPAGWSVGRRLLCRTACREEGYLLRRASRSHPAHGPTHPAFEGRFALGQADLDIVAFAGHLVQHAQQCVELFLAQ
ncbi:hypothetical protein GCM10007860_04490 [Chitiniphilus shinanonensis]|uniref:Uncharacterized protein n=1 Tax=Chitiniphilus shinanonensis TaxID=553088 RepID=A0ABQ6BN54_9NEIS|nr:hypothetical protein GCM10007860_04490 [Chitiniphilus shinanonensis]